MKIAKTLTLNDVGLTGGHQAGLHVPKDSPLTEFIPLSVRHAENPRVTVTLIDSGTGRIYNVTLVYYNNAKRGGTRDEFRMTGTTALLKALGATAGDELLFDLAEMGLVQVTLTKAADIHAGDPDQEQIPIKLDGKWRFIGGMA